MYSYEESNHFQDWSYKTLPEKESFIRKYDRAGRCIEETNEFGTKHMSYTPMDDVCVVTEAEEQRTEYHYDLLGNLKEITCRTGKRGGVSSGTGKDDVSWHSLCI